MVVTETRAIDSRHKEPVPAMEVLEQIQFARQNERLRLSAEIHDGVAQWLTAAAYRVKFCRSLALQNHPEELETELADIEQALRSSIHELRRIIVDLRPFPLEELGLPAAMSRAAANLDDHDIECRVSIEEPLAQLTPAQEQATLGVVREALSNVWKHSRATRAHVRLRFSDGTLTAEIRDNGFGFNPEDVMRNETQTGCFGILGMKDRARSIGARLQIDSFPGSGTSVRLSFPVVSSDTTPAKVRR